MIRKTSAEGPNDELAWFKSSYSSNSSEADCLEVATTPCTIHIRDSKQAAHGPRLTVSGVAWADFVAYARR